MAERRDAKSQAGPQLNPVALGEAVGALVAVVLVLTVGYSTWNRYGYEQGLAEARSHYALGARGYVAARAALDSIRGVGASEGDYYQLSASVWLLKSDNHEEAAKEYEQLDFIQPGHPAASVGLGLAKLLAACELDDRTERRQLCEEATSLFDAAVESSQDQSASPVSKLAGESLLATFLVNRAAALVMSDPGSNRKLDKALGMLAEAEESLQAQGDTQKVMLAVEFNRALITFLRGEYEQCVNHLQLVIQMSQGRLAPWDDAAPQNLFRHALIQMLADRALPGSELGKRADLAREILLDTYVVPGSERASRWGLDQGLARLWNDLGVAFLRAERWPDAVASFVRAEKYIRKGDTSAPLLTVRINIAKAHLGSAERLDKPKEKAISIGKAKEAFALAADAAGSDEELKYQCLMNAGTLAAHPLVDDYTLAKKSFERALKLKVVKESDREAEVHRRLGIVFEAKRKRRDAVKHYEEARSLNHPDDYELGLRIEKLERGR